MRVPPSMAWRIAALVLLAGTSVSNSKTQPYGCHIAYKGDN